ncbi:hypothetical protein VTK73DRAFT_3376 [Phialemonium thermophilum]|uniref:Uncharacterized protein n=1 Tax=Phialemonium thermophilum TaxID=223376 RepID=A0ABR3VJ11_9PEZI
MAGGFLRGAMGSEQSCCLERYVLFQGSVSGEARAVTPRLASFQPRHYLISKGRYSTYSTSRPYLVTCSNTRWSSTLDLLLVSLLFLHGS